MNKPVTICLAGYGGFGKRLHGYLEKMPYFRVKYIYHPDSAKAAQYGPLGASDLNSLLIDPGLEAFVIATPHDQHGSMLRAIVDTGRHHVFVEKPMVATLAEGASLPVPFSHKIFMVGHNQRREAVFRKAKELLNSGVIGKVVDVHFNFSHGGAYTVSPENWRCSAKRNREGPLAMLGSHAIDTIRYLFGEEGVVG